MSDPIRDALEAAALEISARHLEWDGKPPEVWDCHRHMAAAAAVAFLRTLPRASVMIARDDGQWHSTATLAAAVEAAGRE